MFHSEMLGVEFYGFGDGLAGYDDVVDGLDREFRGRHGGKSDQGGKGRRTEIRVWMVWGVGFGC